MKSCDTERAGDHCSRVCILKKNKKKQNDPSLTVKWAWLDVSALQSGAISHAGLMSTDEANCPSPPPKTFGIWSPSSALMEMGSPPPNLGVSHLHSSPPGGSRFATERRPSVCLTQVKRHCVRLHRLIGLGLHLPVRVESHACVYHCACRSQQRGPPGNDWCCRR